MCFGSKSQRDSSAVGPKPAASVPQQNSASVPPASKTSYPAPQQQQQQPQQQPEEYAPPPGPPPGSSQSPRSAPPVVDDDFAPPPGPPPSHTPQPPAATSDDFAPPPGPPPSHTPQPPAATSDDYAPPPGPPPGAAAGNTTSTTEYALPLGPPPDYSNPAAPAQQQQQQQQQQPQHDWQAAVPDTSLFPPPPDIFSHHEFSPANNASEFEMEAGEAWCAAHPLSPPLALDPPSAAAHEAHNPRLMQPANFRGLLRWLGQGHWELRTADRRCTDATVLAYPPLYCAGRQQQPPQPSAAPRKPTVVYYEVQIRSDSRADETSLAVGFAALPYPPFRLPGWHRASLAVHGDDGHRYTNDLAGGCSFTRPFRRGERIGLGMKFAGGPGGRVVIFFTRGGKIDGSWDLHEETDATEVGGVQGLEGWHDISAAIGTFDFVSLEVFFEPTKWLYKGGGQDVM
ncbi:hypothetical protein MGG_01220 [Pyricularia oryzae 70-15]|uniref:SPRY domain-containing protein n=3 Tax=Pyricularia oryzae TaxID=318829 RepID=G4MXI1_PYRO7|nr:uncharacterized protein MGG_01220 [Pyricularia oryzae 70-15]EHA54312.1 hypothetical protein MGG_01220 [Pyricularia oryzae 70-15]ELQ37420.1 hypothetical protein OOU_Y34scaffold00594g4 [Pyricularia oryzae Y34]KAI7923852.1 hypothetical protein M9X92_004147 [Pyricularia oryzae]KAI7929526.1 hypothetical protein M0657_002204 [Pyricularia oryzae]